MSHVLYILMRNDMDSLTPGKAAAQAAHAASDCAHFHGKSQEYAMWQKEAETFGTTIVLGVDENTLLQIVGSMSFVGIPHGLIKDPEYPLQDGATIHRFPVITCGWVLLEKSDVSLEYLPLY